MAMLLQYLRVVDDPSKALRLVVGSSVIIFGTKVVHEIYTRRILEKLLARKREESIANKKNLLDKLKQLKTPLEQMGNITGFSMLEVKEKINSGELKMLDVLQAYQAKALTTSEDTNSVSEVIVEAEDNVLEMIKNEKQKEQLLRGIPISLKDMVPLRGYDTAYGLSKLLFKPEIDDCVLVKVLRSQGAIPFMRTNMSQLAMSFESNNPIYGETVNFVDHKRTPGGSSGGEGALIASGGSLLGFGTDLGGSIRVPSSHSGICGFKPTVDRISWDGINPPNIADKMIPWTIGPMARDVESVVLCMRAVLSSEMYRLDPHIPFMPFNEDLFARKHRLRIGYHDTINGLSIPCVPAVKRAVLLAKSALESMGHELVPFQPPNVSRAIFELSWSCYWNDGGESLREAWRDEKVDYNLKDLHNYLFSPKSLKSILSILWKPFNALKAKTYATMKGCNSPDDIWKLHDKVSTYGRLFHSEWQKVGLDAVIGPTAPFPAPTLGNSDNIVGFDAYTTLYNLLQYPAGVVPATKVTEADETAALRDYPCKDATLRLVKEMQKESVGLPIGVMCVAMRWRDETSLRIMKDLEEGLKKLDH